MPIPLTPRALASAASDISAAALAVVFASALAGCVTTPPPPRAATAPAATQELPDLYGRAVVAEWQRRLEAHITADGGADPAALALLPALRSSSVLRPGQIVFAATDIEAFAPERDGFDAFGLLVGKQDGAAGPRYVFIVGTVVRNEYRAVALADVRTVALSVRDGDAQWEVGPADMRALALYQRGGEAVTAVRFPAEHDQFRLVACLPAVCVEEQRSGARWTLPAAASVAIGRPSPASAAATR